jgi:hypothetical protein
MYTVKQIKRLYYKRFINIDHISNTFTVKSSDIFNTTLNTTLTTALNVVKQTEERIKIEKLDNVDIQVGITMGPINLNIVKKITLE